MTNARFGGITRILLGNGTTLTMRKDKLDVMPAGYKATVESNANGSLYQTLENVPNRAEITLQDEGQDWQEVLLYQGPMTVQEDSTGVTHMYTNAFFDGAPQINRKGGDVTGLAICSGAGDYKRIG
jgi:hypothetical protein